MIEKRTLPSGRISWRVRWWHGDSERSKSFRTRREALHFDRERQQAQAVGKYVDPQKSRLILGELWKHYMAAQVHLKPGTRSGYEVEWRLRIAPIWASAPLRAITREGVQSWVREMSQKLSPASVRYAHRVFSLLLQYAVETRRLAENPAKGVNLPKRTKSARRYLTAEELLELDEELRRIAEPVYADIVLTMGLTGLRVGEATALTVEDYDPDALRLTVNKANRQIAGAYVLGTPKSPAAYRQVAVPAAVAAVLGKREGEPGSPLFVTRRGAVVRPENLRRATAWQETVTRLGHPGLTLHDLRHTAASLAVQAGANVKVLQRMLGHASAAMTLDVYADLLDRDVDDVAVRLNAVMGQ